MFFAAYGNKSFKYDVPRVPSENSSAIGKSFLDEQRKVKKRKSQLKTFSINISCVVFMSWKTESLRFFFTSSCILLPDKGILHMMLVKENLSCVCFRAVESFWV